MSEPVIEMANPNSGENVEIEMEIQANDAVSAAKAEAYAVGERNGVPVTAGDPAYHNNAKYYTEMAQHLGNLTVDATTGAAGSEAEATVTTIEGNPHIDFTIPRGDKGETGNTGATPNISIGTVTDLPAGSTPTATMTGTPENPVLNLGLVHGLSGNETIDDTAGIGDTDLVFSADKLTKDRVSLEVRKANAENLYLYKEASGDIVTVDDAAAEAVKQMRIEVAPVQDLHGYDYPWPAGGGKNKFNSGLMVSPTTSAQWVQVTLKANTAYTVSSNIPNSYASAYIFAIAGTDTSSVTSGDNGVGLNRPQTITTGSDGIISFGYRTKGEAGTLNLDDYTYQIEEGSTATAYAPYSNICPISGWTGANVTRTGKNLFSYNNPTYEGYIINQNGELIENSDFNVYVFDGGKIYTFSYVVPANYDTVRYGTMKNGVYTRSTSTNNPLIIDGTNADYVFLTLSVANQGYILINPMLEIGTEKTAYEPFGTVYPITFPSEAGTVYGGTLTVNQDGTGSLVVDKASVLTVSTQLHTDASVTTIAESETSLSFWIVLTLAPAHTMRNGFLLCDKLRNSSGTYFIHATDTYSRSYNIAIPVGTCDATASAIRLYLNTNPYQIVYELADPITYTLSISEVITLLTGLNNVWSDTGSILSMLYPVNNKADKDGEYEHLTAGSALQLLGEYTEENEPYVFRKTPVASKRVREKLVGGTVAWNQSITQKTQTITPNGTTTYSGQYITATNCQANHVYFASCEIIYNGSLANTTYLASPTGKYGIPKYLISGTKTKCEWLAKPNNNGSISVGISNTNTSDVLTSSDVWSYDNMNCFDITQMFGSTIADALYAMEQATPGSGIAWFRSLFPKDYYAYNAGELMSVQAGSKKVYDEDDNLLHTYPLDSDLILRGIPNWDSTAGKMYYDGDEYTADGTVTRKYGVVDLGSLTWTYGSSNQLFSASLTNIKANTLNMITTKYKPVGSYNDVLNTDKSIRGYNGNQLFLHDSGYSSASTLNTALSGVYLVYELETPTTETADPYQEVQICDGSGTEEFVDGGNRDVAVPVGHESKYSADIWQVINELRAMILELGT